MFPLILIGKVLLELALGAAFVRFGVITLRGDTRLLLPFERLDLRPGAALALGVAALVAGSGLIVGLGVPDAGVFGSAIAALTLTGALISYVPKTDPPFARIYAVLGLLGLVLLVGALHLHDRPLLPWLPH